MHGKPGVLVWSRMTRRSRDIAKQLNIELYHIGDRPPYIRAWLATPRIFREAGGRDSCIILQLPPGPAVMRATMIRERPKLLCDCHTGMFHYRNFKDYILNRPFRRFLRKCDGILVHNPESKELLSHLLGDSKMRDEIHVIYDPLPLAAETRRPENLRIEWEYLVLPASWDADENLYAAIRGYLLSPAPKNNVKLVVTGDPGRRLRRERRLRRLLEENSSLVVLAGYQPYESYMWLIQHSLAVIALTNWEYTVLSVVWEAALYRKPILYARTRTLANLFSGTDSESLSYEVDNPESMSKAIEWIMEHRDSLNAVGDRMGRKLVKLSRESMHRLRSLCIL